MSGRRDGMQPSGSWRQVEDGENTKREMEGMDGRQRQAADESNSAMHWGCIWQPNCEPRLLKAPSQRRKSKREIRSYTVLSPSPSSLFAQHTSLQRPAGTNYSILMRIVLINCFGQPVTPSYTCWLWPPQLNSPFRAPLLPQLAWCSLTVHSITGDRGTYEWQCKV